MASTQTNDPIGEAHRWFEGSKSDLTNPFQTRDQLSVIMQNHDRLEAQMKQNGSASATTQNMHDFYTECMNLVSAWKAGQDKVAASKPAADMASEAARSWGVGLFQTAGIATEGKSFEQLSSDPRNKIPSGAQSAYENQITSAKTQIESAKQRQGSDPSAKWDIEYWTAYQSEVTKYKDFIVANNAAMVEERNAGTYVPPPLPPAIQEQIERNKDQNAIVAEENVAAWEAANGSGSNYLWWGVGISLAAVLVFAVVA